LFSSAPVSRRRAVGLSLAGLAPAVFPQLQEQGQDPPSDQLPYPRMVGRPKERVTDYENDPFIIEIEERLRCTCGCNLDVYTCRTTDFTCATSPAMHREVVKLVEQGSTAQEVIDAFVAEHGELVLMAPKKEGFNLVGYVLPGMAITAVGAVMLWVLARRSKVTAASMVSDPGFGQGSGISAEDAARLESELADLE